MPQVPLSRLIFTICRNIFGFHFTIKHNDSRFAGIFEESHNLIATFTNILTIFIKYQNIPARSQSPVIVGELYTSERKSHLCILPGKLDTRAHFGDIHFFSEQIILKCYASIVKCCAWIIIAQILKHWLVQDSCRNSICHTMQ
jgi:hypothetical protein